MKLIIKFVGIISAVCLSFFPYVVYSGASFLFFGERPVPKNK